MTETKKEIWSAKLYHGLTKKKEVGRYDALGSLSPSFRVILNFPPPWIPLFPDANTQNVTNKPKIQNPNRATFSYAGGQGIPERTRTKS